MLSASDRSAIQTYADHADPAVQRRARLLLLYDDGKPTAAVAEAVGLAPRTVQRWRRRYLDNGLAIFPEPDQTLEEPAAEKPAAEEPAAEEPAAEEPAAEEPAPEGWKDVFGHAREVLSEPKKLRKKLKRLSRRKALKRLKKALKAERKAVRRLLKTKKLKRKKRAKAEALEARLTDFLNQTKALLAALD